MFDKELFKELLLQAMGDLNTTEYSKLSGVNRTYISKLLNNKMDNPPSPEILKGLASTAKNNVTYTDFMKAAGYIKDEDIESEFNKKNLENSSIRNTYKQEEKLKKEFQKEYKALDEFRQVMINKGFNYENKTYEELAEIIAKHIKIQELLNNNDNNSKSN